MKHYITKEEFYKAVATSFSIRESLQKLGLTPAGGNYETFYKRIKDFHIDTSHFTGKLWNKGKVLHPKRPIEDYLSNSFSIHSHALRLRLIKETLKGNICEMCHNTMWLGNSIPLELNHIDGNHVNNTLSNLQILCPNCHALTPNYRGKNVGHAN